jgi:hypothetical protein
VMYTSCNITQSVPMLDENSALRPKYAAARR